MCQSCDAITELVLTRSEGWDGGTVWSAVHPAHPGVVAEAETATAATNDLLRVLRDLDALPT